MSVFFELLQAETYPAVRVVLGHFIFVFIHPFFDGKGRTARFLMNVMLAASGHPLTVIKVDNRAAYTAPLEAASVRENIVLFAKYLADALRTKKQHR
ncbi:Fic family protein [Octadecabacter sp. G9-8]|uniref:Fic family protein n=1 Tax=Octadecabacter dasysiphoniae TaxID=2909341 RepID=A0ABS9CQE3_9RHOB|nr:Fic family protein [Octadecabacter dasysiphoniae]MCF2869451.1 Fic family protein [Octadecabacter dasysiphoniae]